MFYFLAVFPACFSAYMSSMFSFGAFSCRDLVHTMLPLTQCTALPYSRDVQCHSHAANLCPQGDGCQCACTSSVFFSARCVRCCVHLVLRKCILPLVLCPGKLDFASLSHGWLYHLHNVAQVSGLGAHTMPLLCAAFDCMRASQGCNWAV